ncbi:MAG: transposase, partial [Thermoanaerobaculaceae bacterium]|nr:transposase [Thermoanaerobaculaceae bacterium]
MSLAPLDPKEFLARVLMHIPEPRRHVIRYYGAYSSVVRARRARQAVAAGGAPLNRARAGQPRVASSAPPLGAAHPADLRGRPVGLSPLWRRNAHHRVRHRAQGHW